MRVSKEMAGIIHRTDEPKFVKLYLVNTETLLSLAKREQKLLFRLLKMMNLRNNRLILLDEQKQRIMQDLEWKLSNLNKALHNLRIDGILIKISNGTYQINPHLFAGTEWNLLQRIILKFDAKLKEIRISLKNKEEGKKEKKSKVEKILEVAGVEQ